ncbi:MAG: ubiquinone/menaquinone biosynthesis C-methylase UbiE [Bacteriovoracaceae bacterium]|jgi:ubiquinone/menaquinone biosynthesis C-methylase UbiE
MNKSIENLLFCPSSKEKVSLKDGELFSQSTSYPFFNKIPWLFKDPEYHFLQWGTKIESYIKEEEIYIKHLQAMTNLNENKLTRKRMTKIQEAKSKNLKVISKTLEQFRGHQQIALSASTQQIHSYFQLIFRDWSWDSDENDKYFSFVKEKMPKDAKNVLILGCGAGRLSYDLATNFTATNFISIDHNPFLLLTAQKIFEGEEVKLSDYTNYPKDIESTSKTYKIKREKNNIDNHQFVLGSFPDLPFKEQTYDMIIAPWFFDILDLKYFESVNHALKYLKPNGTFTMFGPNNVHKNYLMDQLTSEEIKEELTPFFDESSMKVETLQYLKNPLSSQNRIEDVMFFSGISPKVKDLALNTPTKPTMIHFDPTFEHHKAINQTFFNILKHIDQDMTLEELGKKLVQEFGFKESEAIYYAKNFIQKISQDMQPK